MKSSTTKKLVLTALLMALTVVATMFIRIPLPMGYVNLGDAFVLLSVFMLGPIYGTIAAGVGSTLADLLGYPTYAPGTLIIKTVMALVAFVIYKLLLKATGRTKSTFAILYRKTTGNIPETKASWPKPLPAPRP